MIKEKLDKLGIIYQPVAGVQDMVQIGKRGTTIHCYNAKYILYVTDTDMENIMEHKEEFDCVVIDVQDMTKEECSSYLSSNSGKFVYLQHGNHVMNASAPKYQPHRIYTPWDEDMDVILDILAQQRNGGKGMTKIDCVWIGTAALAYDICLDKTDWTLEDIHFSQQEIVNYAKQLIGDEIPNALVSQHACAYSNSQNRNCMYLVAKNVKRRISYTGEFSGKTERPDFSEMKNNIVVSTKHGEVAIDTLIKFVDEVYSPKVKQLLEEHFSKYDLGSVFDYIKAYEGKHFIAVDKAGAQASEMEKHKELGTAARSCVKGFSEEIKNCMPRYEKTDVTNWINQGQNTDEYIWAQLRQKDKVDMPTSISVFFERMRINGAEKQFELRISIEAQDSKCVKENGRTPDPEKYYRHARLLNIAKKPGLDYYVGGSLPGELMISNKTPQEILSELHGSKNKKVQICKVMTEADVRSKSAYEVYQFMIQAAYELEPYYLAAVADDDGKTVYEEEVGDTTMGTTINPNMILYGPPGTGKTYNSVVYAVAICEEKDVEEVEKEDYDLVKARYEELKAAGRIAFTTFHQSYGYEEFIEGIRPIMSNEQTDTASQDGSQLKYRVEPGVFKKFCDDAKKVEVKTDKFDYDKNAVIWKVTVRPEVKEDCFKNDRVRINWGLDSEGAVGFVNDMKKGDLILTTDGSRSTINGIAIVVSEDAFELEEAENDRTTRNVTWLATDISEDITSINAGKILHRMTCARVPKMAVADAVSLAMKKNSNLAGTEIEENTKPHVFIIDEINRGNISKIFGELITLIEDTKRMGKDEQASAILPYSGEEFSVPANVYILGTMNTADRSIALMDTALRRRFSFIEKMPKPELLNDVSVEQNGVSVNVGEMLDIINKRIEFLFDREHTIGHAFFMKLKKNSDINVLADIFKRSVVPLLQEYFYEDYEKIQLVLGDSGKVEERFKFIKNETITPSNLFNGRTRLEKTEKYVINESAFQWIDSYIGILKPAADNKEE